MAAGGVRAVRDGSDVGSKTALEPRRLGVLSALAWATLVLTTAVAAAEDSATPSAGPAAPAVESTAPATPPVSADGDAQGESEDERIDALETKVDVLARELSKAITAATVPEDEKLTSFEGLGPAASKVYYRDRGLSVGSYGEILLRSWVTDENDGSGGQVSNDDIFDALRAVLYVGYKFNDQWVVNSELEFEHAGTSGGGSVSAEFVTVDYMPRDWLSFRVGLVLIPMGFINEIHEPVFFYGANRPDVEQRIIPTTWRENGAGIFGTYGRFTYRMYAVNGFDATGFSAEGLRGGRQKGSRAFANDWAFVGRVDVDVIDGLVMGGSVYTGKAGQQQSVCVTSCSGGGTPVLAPVPGTLTTLYEVHAAYRRWGLTVKALLTQAFLEDTAQLNLVLGNGPNSGKAIASQMLGWYAVAAYDVLPLIFSDTRMSLEPYFRYERVDTQNEMPAGFVRNSKWVQDIYTVGLHFKPLSQVVFKVDYQNIRPESDPDDVADEVRFAVGYVF
jgi:hypothetical protein